MNLYEASFLARSLLEEHGLRQWSFAFDRARRRFGSCQYAKKRITLSRTLTFMNGQQEVRDTLLHEIAHALTPGAGHGPAWRRMCRKIGARPVRCYSDQSVLAPPRRSAPYELGCARCDWWVDRRRLTRRRYTCRHCGGICAYRHKASRAPRPAPPSPAKAPAGIWQALANVLGFPR